MEVMKENCKSGRKYGLILKVRFRCERCNSKYRSTSWIKWYGGLCFGCSLDDLLNI